MHWYKINKYNTLNVKLSHSQLNKLKSGIKNSTEVTLKISSNVVGDSNDGNNSLHKYTILFTNTQVLRFRIAFANKSSPKIELAETQLHKIIQSRGFLGKLLAPLLKAGLLLIGNVLKPLTKSVLMPLGSIPAAAATDVTIHKKLFVSGTTTLRYLKLVNTENFM